MNSAPARSASVADDAGELRLGADEEHVLAAQHDVARELLRDLDLPKGLLEIDDVDPVALGENEAAHLGVPTTGLVPEVDAGREESLERGRVGGRLLVCHVVRYPRFGFVTSAAVIVSSDWLPSTRLRLERPVRLVILASEASGGSTACRDHDDRAE